MYSAVDHQFMREALAEAQKAFYLSNPNPRVGCVIVKSGQVIGRGYTQKVGDAHAEVQALADAKAQGVDPVGSTIYVTLSPCISCARIIYSMKIKKVIYLNSYAAYKGLASDEGVDFLRKFGVEVQCYSDL
jgi:diaminohydroxyphosphoribosylaminopyrimidine deaminase/5-amino-6-(5-phosphoribosylamino)uracil reductase